MNQIDEAFINAYLDHPPRPATPSDRTLAQAPRREPASENLLRVFSGHQVSQSQSIRVDAGTNGATAPHSLGLTAKKQGARAAVTVAVPLRDPVKLPPLGGTRRPLSTFSAPADAPASVFRPAFEVDSFRWPSVTNHWMENARDHFRPVLESLTAGSDSGHSLIGLAGTRSGVGCSMVALCLARFLAEAGKRVALVDANFANGELGAHLGLNFEHGWLEALEGTIPLAECAVQSLNDGIVIVPVTPSHQKVSDCLAGIQSAVIAGILRYHYDLVLFDLGAASDSDQLEAAGCLVDHCRLDRGIIIARSGATDSHTNASVQKLSEMFGPICLGIIGNRAN